MWSSREENEVIQRTNKINPLDIQCTLCTCCAPISSRILCYWYVSKCCESHFQNESEILYKPLELNGENSTDRDE